MTRSLFCLLALISQMALAKDIDPYVNSVAGDQLWAGLGRLEQEQLTDAVSSNCQSPGVVAWKIVSSTIQSDSSVGYQGVYTSDYSSVFEAVDSAGHSLPLIRVRVQSAHLADIDDDPISYTFKIQTLQGGPGISCREPQNLDQN